MFKIRNILKANLAIFEKPGIVILSPFQNGILLL